LVSLERPDHGIQDILITERFRQEVDGSSFHCLDRHRNVAVTRHKDDRDANIRLSQFGLKVETADPRQPNIEDQAACNIGHLDLRKFAGRTEQLDPQAYRSEKTAESRAHRYVVVDDEDDSFRCARGDVLRFWAPGHSVSSRRNTNATPPRENGAAKFQKFVVRLCTIHRASRSLRRTRLEHFAGKSAT